MKKLLQLCLGLLACFLFTPPCFAIGENNPTGVTGSWNGSVTTAGSYDPYTGNAKRVVDDIVVTGSIGAYPLKWSRVWNSRGGGGAFGNSNWWHSYVWGMWTKLPQYNYIDNQYEGPAGQITYPDGRRVILENWAENWWVLMGGAEPMDRLVYMGNYNYDLVMRDGGRVRFIAPGPPNSNGYTSFTATAVIDPYGQVTTIAYDSLGRFSRITEPGGRYLQINYQRLYSPVTAGSYVDVISSVQAFASPGNLTETVTYHYAQEVSDAGFVYSTFNYLTSVDYDDSSHAYYTYNPAGRSEPGNGWSVLAGPMKSCDDVRAAGPMKRIRYEYMVLTQEHPEVAWGQLKAEKNWDGQTLSEMEYPVYNPSQTWDPGWRKEHRGDGAIRTFQYTGAELSSYTDFLNHTSSIGYGPAAGNPNNYVQSFTDARGNVTRSEKENEAGQVIRRTNPDGTSLTFAYEYVDGAPYYLQIRGDELGRNTYFTRDGSHRVSKVWYSYNGDPAAFPTEEFTYNNFGQVLSHKLTTGGTETFGYDEGMATARGLKTSHIDPVGNVTTFTYYTSGPNTDRLYMVIDPRGNATAYEYNQRGQITKVQHQDWTYTQSGYNPDGTLAWTSDELGHTTRYAYDEYKRVLTVTNPLNQTTTNNYALDWVNPLLHTTASIKYTYSPMGKSIFYDYDANYRKTAQIVARWTADEAASYFGYDEVGNLTRTTDPRGHVTTFGYDTRNRQTSVTNALDQTTTMQFDGVGNKIRETRADGAFRTWEYEPVNPMNRLDKAVDWRMSLAEPEVATVYGRNVTATYQTIKDSKGAVYNFYYDAMNRKASLWYPVDATGATRYEYWQYDAAGNIERHDTPAGHVQVFGYDNRNRLTRSLWWFQTGPDVTTTYDAASRVTSVSTNNNETIVAFGYDDANRQIWEDQTLSGYPTRRVETARDADGNRTSLHVAGVYYIEYGYTARNQLASIGGFANFTYDKSGNMTRRQGVWCYANEANFEYDDLNRMTMAEQGSANGWIFARSHYQYDKVSRETATWRDEDNGLGSGRGERFEYEPTNQVKKVWYNALNAWSETPTNQVKLEEFNYPADKLNRASVTTNGAVTNYVMPNGMNQYTNVGGQTIGYDNHFNIASYNGLTFSYDAANQLVGGSMQCTYDGLGRCVRRTTQGGTRLFTYDGWKPILEWVGWGGWLAWNVYGAGADEILARYDWAGRISIYKQDKQGSVVALLDGNGNVSEKYRYDAFGQPTVSDYWGNVRTDENGKPVSWCDNRFMFTGREWITELGIYDYRHRMYHPGLGRFLQVDPIGFDAGDMNLFRYCDDDPVDGSDPTGLVNTNAGTTLEERLRLFYGSGDTGGGLYDLNVANSHTVSLAQMKQISPDGIPVTGGFKSRREMEDNAVAKDYAQIDKSGIGRKDRPEYGGLSLQRKGSDGKTEYGFTGPYKGKQGRVEDKYRKMREANYLIVHGPGSLPVPRGWTKIGWHYAHVIPGNTIPVDDKAVARDLHYHVVGAAPPLKRTIYYNPNIPMVDYYP